jgi:predicted HicB family RNase H-like nuclease
MQLSVYIEALEQDLAAIAAVGDEHVAAAAGRLSQALRSSLGLRLLDLLGEAALEVSAQVPSGHVEVRLAGQDPSLVYVPEEAEPASPSGPDDELTARITLRLPDSLKGAIEVAASSEGVSVNTWLVRALARSVSSKPRGPGSHLTGYAKS